MTSTASSKIILIKQDRGCEYENSDQYRWGFEDAKERAADIAHKHDLAMVRMSVALESIALNDPRVVEILGEDTASSIRYALKSCRDLEENQKTKEEPTHE